MLYTKEKVSSFNVDMVSSTASALMLQIIAVLELPDNDSLSNVLR